ncbi:MAG: UBP-type zinc finger domain-containing protein [Pseudonocardia sp.]
MTCPHTEPFDAPSWVEPAPAPGHAQGCVDCLALGEDVWAHLRLCLSCGHVACCDSSPHRHAETHARDTGHPVMRSFEPGESWRWCYLDERVV